jgi:peptide/nickel transport system substrate-binding protein
MAHYWYRKPKAILSLALLFGLALAIACGAAEKAAPTTAPAAAKAPATAATPIATKAAPAATAVPTAAPAPTTGTGLIRAPEANPQRGGIFKQAVLSNPAHHDLHQCATLACIAPMAPMFDNLVRFSPFEPGLTVVIPDLAKSWDVSADGLTYTFRLRDGVKFHDGTPFSADDVKATFDRIIFPPKGVFSARKANLEAVKEVKVIDPLTVQLVLREPRGFLLQVLALSWNTIESKKVLEANNNDLKRAKGRPGTGPFKFLDQRQDEFWKYEKNRDYWNPDLPYVDGMETLSTNFGPPTAAVFLAGQVDYAYGIDPISAKRASGTKGFNVSVVKSPSFLAFWPNHTKKPFNDVRVRKAMDLVLNKAAINKAQEDIQTPSQEGWLTHVDPLFAAYWEKAKNQPGYRVPTADDIAEAKRLMGEAGYAGGLKNVGLIVRDVPFQTAWAPVVQALLKQHLNIETNITVSPGGNIYEVLNAGDFDLALQATGMDLAAVQNYWQLLFRTGGDQNWERYSSPEFDAIFDKIIKEGDRTKVAELVRQGIQILDRDVPISIWSGGASWQGWTDRLKGHRIELKAIGYDPDRWETVWLQK